MLAQVLCRDLELKPEGIQILEPELIQELILEVLLLDLQHEIIIHLREVQQEVDLLEAQVRHVEVAADPAHLDEVVTYNRITKKLI